MFKGKKKKLMFPLQMFVDWIGLKELLDPTIRL